MSGPRYFLHAGHLQLNAVKPIKAITTISCKPDTVLAGISPTRSECFCTTASSTIISRASTIGRSWRFCRCRNSLLICASPLSCIVETTSLFKNINGVSLVHMRPGFPLPFNRLRAAYQMSERIHQTGKQGDLPPAYSSDQGRSESFSPAICCDRLHPWPSVNAQTI